MPKRSAEEKLERYRNKIKRIEDKARSRRIRIMSSEDDGDVTCEQIHSQEMPESQVNLTVFNEPIQSSADLELTDPTPEPATVPGDSLDPELLSALGVSTSDNPEFGASIHDSLSALWPTILKKGINKEEKQKLISNNDYLAPDNCKLIQAPKLNAEISAAITDSSRYRDKKYLNMQQQLGTGITAINRAMDVLLKSDNKAQALKYLSDGCRTLCDLHFEFTKDRTKMILPSLDKIFLHILQDTDRDDMLFGKSLSEKIKASKAIEKQGNQIKKTTPKSVVASSPTFRPNNQGNWNGSPSRHSAARGGRGGQRRPPAPPPQTRRQHYPQTHTKPPMTSARFRAPNQH